ncbi:MAG: protein-disulfide reductase DsbD [Pseudomonadota bacterium]|nr:protein-disulfide reductase DsbD [Pseudomonadota bacterium]
MKLTNKIFLFILISIFLFTHDNIISSVKAESELSKDLNSTNEFLHPDKAFIVKLKNFEKEHIEVGWDIADGYYLYLGMFKFEINSNNTKIESVEMPDGLKKTDEFFGDVDVYYNNVNAKIILSNTPIENFKLTVHYQGCADAGLCYPPAKKSFLINIESTKGFFQKTSLPTNQIGISNILQSKSILYNVFLFYIAGLLLAFTPCVFPMIPILTGLIVGQGQNISTKKSFLLSLTYVFSMSITYAIIGIIFALSGSNIQANLQNPYVITAFASLFIFLALAMFKIINLQMPTFIQTSLSESSNQLKPGSFYGVGMMGSLSALIIGPCVTAPLIGALIYIASTNDYVLGGFALFALGFGMGTPLLALGTSATTLVKKIGPYLDITNKIFGLLFITVAIWLLERIVSIQIAAYLWALLPATIVFLIYSHGKNTGTSFQGFLSKFISVVMLAYASLLIYGANVNQNFLPITSFINQPTANKFIVVKNSNDLHKIIKESKNLTMVDLYADWCIACKELEMYTFSDKKVSNMLGKMNLVKFDVTNMNDNINLFFQEKKLFGPPALMFFSSDGSEIAGSRIVGFIDAETFSKKLESLNL